MKNKKSGQVALTVLLVMVVVLTIGLSLISHSVTDISISKDEEEAMRAFSAAEAGIEEALKQDDLAAWAPSTVTVGGTTATVTVSEEKDVKERSIEQNEFTNIDLNGPVNLTIAWGDDSVALEAVVYDTNNNVERYAYSLAGTCADGFWPADPGPEATIDITNPNADLMRIRPLCGAATIDISVNSGSLPTQEYIVDSRAAVGGETEEKTSAIEVTRTVEALPSIFDYVLFSKGSLE